MEVHFANRMVQGSVCIEFRFPGATWRLHFHADNTESIKGCLPELSLKGGKEYINKNILSTKSEVIKSVDDALVVFEHAAATMLFVPVWYASEESFPRLKPLVEALMRTPGRKSTCVLIFDR